MTNEYGAVLDRNGYAESIIPDHNDRQCWCCGRNGAADKLDRHEVFGGAYRGKSKRFGLWVHLCHTECHQGPDGVHNNALLDAALKEEAQRCAMRVYGWNMEKWIAEFGKNYLEDI